MSKFFAIFIPILAALISMSIVLMFQKKTSKPMNKKFLLILLGSGILILLVYLGIVILRV